MPSASFKKQIEENNKEIVLKKLSTEIVMGKTTENTAMELDAKGGASFEQLQDLITKECDKRDKKYPSLEKNTTNCRNHSKTRNRKKAYKRGANVAPQTKRNRHRKIVEGCQTNVADRPQSDGRRRNVPDHSPDTKDSRRYQQRHHK